MKPNILFFVIDSLRADRVYGQKKVSQIPNIESLIKNGVYFSNAITTNQYTAQVMQSIFSARFPLRNTKKKLYQKSNKSTSPLSILKNSGYATIATIQEDIILHGFTETFDNDDVAFHSQENIYNGLGEKILQKFDSIPEPWFYYIHLSDLHKPCEVPQKFQHLKLSERYEHNLSEVDSLIGKILSKINLTETLIIITSDHGDYISVADGPRGESNRGKVKVKNSLKKLVPKLLLIKIHLKKQKILQQFYSIRAKTSHEKRNLDSHKMTLNNNLYDDIVHVPLIFSGAKINSVPPISQQICNVDIFPTILEYLDIPTDKLKINGRSLLPFFHGKKYESSPIYLTSQAIMKKLYLSILVPEHTQSPLVGIRTENYKYFRDYNDSKKNIHLYDLINDPLEDENIYKTNPTKIEEMESIISKIQKNYYPLLDIDIDIDIDEQQISEIQNSLKKLGYIQ